MSHKLNDEILEFWRWFLSAIENSNNPFEDMDFIHSLDQKVSQFGRLSWELGPGLIDSQNNAFILSPNGDRKLLELTSAIISMAPKYEGYEFYFAKQPRKWQMRFNMEDENGENIEIDASCWEYVLIGCSKDTFTIIIKMPKMTKLPEHWRHTAAEILLDGELGEEKRINRIAEIQMVSEFENKMKNKCRPMMELKYHLSELNMSGDN